MKSASLSFFESLYRAISDLELPQTRDLAIKADIEGLDPVEASDLIQKRLIDIRPDDKLLNLYDCIKAFQQENIGEFHQFEENHPFVEATVQVTRELSGKTEPSLDMIPNVIAKLEEALIARAQVMTLQQYERSNADALREYRFKKLEEQASKKLQVNDEMGGVATHGNFTHTQQAIAIHYLFQEALGISNIDNTKLMEFAHLLSAKKIPINKETGKENIRNSGIKSAFNKAWKKEDANHLADLRFVLRFFRALNVDTNAGIQTAIAAIEKRIARISEKLNREKD
jgi:hypothetical protein